MAAEQAYCGRGKRMKALRIAGRGDRLSVLCLGAHSDDIEIGLGGTLLSWLDQGIRLDVHWCVLGGADERGREASASATEFLETAASRKIEIMDFRDGFFPEQGDQIKVWFEALKSRVNPDVIFTHRQDDAHQDHRQVVVWFGIRFGIILFLSTRYQNGMAIWRDPIFICPFRHLQFSARWICSFRILAASAPSTGLMLKLSSAWHG